MRIAVSADELTGVAEALPDELRRRGHEPILHGAYVDDERSRLGVGQRDAARDVAEGRAEQAVVACWTGTGASIAANKVPGSARRCAPMRIPRAALAAGTTPTCSRSASADFAAELEEILDAWFAGRSSAEVGDVENVAHLSEIESG